jgi:hypothetical protein
LDENACWCGHCRSWPSIFHDFSCRVRAHQVAAFGSQNQTDDAIANPTRSITEALVENKGWILLSRAPLSLLIMRQLPLKVLWEWAVLEKVKI